jgi:hypothetical protein
MLFWSAFVTSDGAAYLGRRDLPWQESPMAQGHTCNKGTRWTDITPNDNKAIKPLRTREQDHPRMLQSLSIISSCCCRDMREITIRFKTLGSEVLVIEALHDTDNQCYILPTSREVNLVRHLPHILQVKSLEVVLGHQYSEKI